MIEKERQVYLRLEGIYQGDVQIEKGKHVSSFLLHLKDLDGRLYIAPIACQANYTESVVKALQRIKPVVLTFAEGNETAGEANPEITKVESNTEQLH
jgi:hypothetical protein